MGSCTRGDPKLADMSILGLLFTMVLMLGAFWCFIYALGIRRPWMRVTVSHTLGLQVTLSHTLWSKVTLCRTPWLKVTLSSFAQGLQKGPIPFGLKTLCPIPSRLKSLCPMENDQIEPSGPHFRHFWGQGMKMPLGTPSP